MSQPQGSDCVRTGPIHDAPENPSANGRMDETPQPQPECQTNPPTQYQPGRTAIPYANAKISLSECHCLHLGLGSCSRESEGKGGKEGNIVHHIFVTPTNSRTRTPRHLRVRTDNTRCASSTRICTAASRRNQLRPLQDPVVPWVQGLLRYHPTRCCHSQRKAEVGMGPRCGSGMDDTDTSGIPNGRSGQVLPGSGLQERRSIRSPPA